MVGLSRVPGWALRGFGKMADGGWVWGLRCLNIWRKNESLGMLQEFEHLPWFRCDIPRGVMEKSITSSKFKRTPKHVGHC